MVADMIFSRFGITFNPRYVCALPGKIGLSIPWKTLEKYKKNATQSEDIWKILLCGC